MDVGERSAGPFYPTASFNPLPGNLCADIASVYVRYTTREIIIREFKKKVSKRLQTAFPAYWCKGGVI
jgi:hypothetical protein